MGASPFYFRGLALRVRELMAAARTDAAKQQLAIWLEEVEQQAEARERELAASQGSNATD